MREGSEDGSSGHGAVFDLMVGLAIRQAALSPCAKSKRGSVVFNERIGHIASGHNHPPRPYACTGDAACRAACGQICVHAEASAIARIDKHFTRGEVSMDLLHVKAVNGVLAPSGGPSCVACSKAILEDGRIEGVWLFHETGWKRYSAQDFHELSLQAHNLPRSKDA